MRVFESIHPINWCRLLVLLATIIFGWPAWASGFRASDIRLMLSSEISSAEKQELTEHEKPLSALQGPSIELSLPDTAGSLADRNDGLEYATERLLGRHIQLSADDS